MTHDPTEREPLVLRTERRNEELVVTLQGQVDASSARSLGRELCRAADRSAQEVLVDLSAAQLTDPTALGALVLAQNHARRGHRDLVLAGVTGRTLRLLELTGLDRCFRLVPTVASR